MNDAKLKILTTVGNYLPGWKAGGQLRTICNFAEIFGDEFDIRIVTSDRDLGDASPYANTPIDEWTRVGKVDVRYVSPARQGLLSIASLMDETPHDILYLNSFFSPIFTIKPLLAMRLGLARRTPTILAPRGEFSKSAINLKTRKKIAYLRFFEALLFKEPIVFQASSQFEAEAIDSRIHRKHTTTIAPDLVRPAKFERISGGVPDVSDGALRICFISRISPMKNLRFALEVLEKVRARVVFDIYGPIEDRAYWEECQRIIERIPANVSVQYYRQIAHDEIVETFSHYDLFMLPTLGENFGHVVVESMQAGTPVLIADTTPWKTLEEHNAGWVLPLGDTTPWMSCIEKLAESDIRMRQNLRDAAQKYADSIYRDESTIDANKLLFKRAVDA